MVPNLQVGQVWQCSDQRKTFTIEGLEPMDTPGVWEVRGHDQSGSDETFDTAKSILRSGRDCWGVGPEDEASDWDGNELVQLLWCPTWVNQ
jgi:hypothetical protein